jgi:hypothetical protein
VWVGSGNVTVIVPAKEFESISARTGSGVITSTDGSQHRGSFSRSTFGDKPANFDQTLRQLDVSVYVGSGNVTFVQAPSTTGVTQ